jgi:hypothetical protein
MLFRNELVTAAVLNILLSVGVCIAVFTWLR